jgi:hypothetical protein
MVLGGLVEYKHYQGYTSGIMVHVNHGNYYHTCSFMTENERSSLSCTGHLSLLLSLWPSPVVDPLPIAGVAACVIAVATSRSAQRCFGLAANHG